MKKFIDTFRPSDHLLQFFIGFGLLILLTPDLSAQEHDDHHDELEQLTHHQDKHGHFRLSLVIGHTLIPSLVNGEKESLLVPSWGLDIEYWMNHKWGIGLHNDIEVETFEVLSAQQEYVERVFPLVFTLDILWRPWKGLVLLAGPGIEFERNEDLELMRFGVEYEIEIFEHWDLAPNFFYDARFDAFDTWSVGLGVGRRF